METTIVYRGYIGIMERKMETTIVYCLFQVHATSSYKRKPADQLALTSEMAWITFDGFVHGFRGPISLEPGCAVQG